MPNRVKDHTTIALRCMLSSVVRSTGAVIPPLVILFVSLWVLRIPFAVVLLGSVGRGRDLVELSARIAGVGRAVDRVLPLRRMANGADDRSRGYGCGFCSSPYSPLSPNQKPVSAKPMPRRATKFFTGL